MTEDALRLKVKADVARFNMTLSLLLGALTTKAEGRGTSVLDLLGDTLFLVDCVLEQATVLSDKLDAMGVDCGHD